MDLKTIFYWGVGIVFLWWLFARKKNDTENFSISYSTPKTFDTEKEVNRIRQPQNSLAIDKPQNFEINEEIGKVLDALENSNQNIFLTGKAGTGKSTLLSYFRATSKKNPVVVAPTGVAAVNVQGQTIHSFFRWNIDVTPERIKRLSYEKAKIFKNLKMLIIDEISMVRADLFECIDKFLRKNTGKHNLPFGGVQIVAIGDLYQLPPVVKNEERAMFERMYASPYFFSAKAYNKGAFQKFELNTVYRQKDSNFIDALNAIREGVANDSHIEMINQTVIQDEPEDLEDYVNLVPTNNMAKEINDNRMRRLPPKSVVYQGKLFEDFKEENAPTDLKLELKSGAQVMLLNNDRNRKWVNGDVVKVLETRSNSVLVEFDDDTVP